MLSKCFYFEGVEEAESDALQLQDKDHLAE
jgi:hypothetical protein